MRYDWSKVGILSAILAADIGMWLVLLLSLGVL